MAASYRYASHAKAAELDRQRTHCMLVRPSWGYPHEIGAPLFHGEPPYLAAVRTHGAYLCWQSVKQSDWRKPCASDQQLSIQTSSPAPCAVMRTRSRPRCARNAGSPPKAPPLRALLRHPEHRKHPGLPRPRVRRRHLAPRKPLASKRSIRTVRRKALPASQRGGPSAQCAREDSVAQHVQARVHVITVETIQDAHEPLKTGGLEVGLHTHEPYLHLVGTLHVA